MELLRGCANECRPCRKISVGREFEVYSAPAGEYHEVREI